MDFSIFLSVMIGAYGALAVYFGYEIKKYDNIEKELKKRIFPYSVR